MLFEPTFIQRGNVNLIDQEAKKLFIRVDVTLIEDYRFFAIDLEQIFFSRACMRYIINDFLCGSNSVKFKIRRRKMVKIIKKSVGCCVLP